MGQQTNNQATSPHPEVAGGSVVLPAGLKALSYGPRLATWCVTDEYGRLWAEAWASRELAVESALRSIAIAKATQP